MTPALAVLAPILGAAITVLVSPRRTAVTGAIFALASAAAGAALVVAVARDGVQVHQAGGWAAPLGIELRADGLAAVLVATTAVIALAASLYALFYFAHDTLRSNGFWPLWLALWGGLNGLLLTADLFNAYVALELVSLSAVALVALAGGREALGGATRYLFAALLGSLAYLLGVALVFGRAGRLDFAGLGEVAVPSTALTVALGLLTVGLMLKTALFPLHVWLPPAHGSAPAPVSAALSALVVTAAAYLLLRLWFFVFGAVIPPEAVTAAGVLGAAALIWGSAQAIVAERLKVAVAHSTVAQIGYLFVLIPLVHAAPEPSTTVGLVTGDANAWSGGVLHAVAHALAKASVFLAAGAVLQAVGHDRFSGLVGLAPRMPVVIAALGLAGISLAGLPPSGGFTAKWLMITSALEAGAWVWVVVLAGGTLLGAAYVLRFVYPAFAPAPAGPAAYDAVPRTMQWTALALALLAVGMGLRAEELAGLLEVGR